MEIIKTADKAVNIAQVIITSLTLRGNGSTTPVRRIRQVYTMDGDLIAEYDPLIGLAKHRYTLADMKVMGEYLIKNITINSDPEKLLDDWLNTYVAIHEQETQG